MIRIQDTTLVKFTTESNKGFHLFIMVKEEATQSISQEHDLVDTRRKTDVKLCKNWPENFLFTFVADSCQHLDFCCRGQRDAVTDQV